MLWMTSMVMVPSCYNVISIKAAPQIHVNEQGVNDLSNATHLLFRRRWIIERG